MSCRYSTYDSDDRGRANCESYRPRAFRKVFVRENKVIKQEAEVEHRENQTWQVVM